jgi:hypothetical protein
MHVTELLGDGQHEKHSELWNCMYIKEVTRLQLKY